MTRKPARSPGSTDRRSCARAVAVQTLVGAVERFPDLEPIQVDTEGLAPRDAALAKAIVGHTLRRWLSLEHLLDGAMRRPLNTQKGYLQAVLLTGAAQLVCLDRVPARAVVHEAVEMVKRQGDRKAAGFVNAVLRKVASRAHQCETFEVGGAVEATCGDEPGARSWDDKRLMSRLGRACGCPAGLLRRWVREYGLVTGLRVARYGAVIPPVLVSVEEGFSGDEQVGEVGTPDGALRYGRWRGHAGGLSAWLAGHPERRVQDPTAGRAAASTSGLNPAVILDLCAGRGTKTKQLAVTHPGAVVVATDTSAERLADLREVAARFERVVVCRVEELDGHVSGPGVDLLVLDVPCTNTGVIARRPEARYRFSAAGLQDIVCLQRRIIDQGLSRLAVGGHLLYSTCSLEAAENQRQVRWACRRGGLALVYERTTLPACRGGRGRDEVEGYGDGGYYALLLKCRD